MNKTEIKNLIKKEPFFEVEEFCSYFCSSDIGLASYLVYKGHKLSGIQTREDGEIFFLLKGGLDTEEIADHYQMQLSISEAYQYLDEISTLTK
jgi:hypothetical protein